MLCASHTCCFSLFSILLILSFLATSHHRLYSLLFPPSVSLRVSCLPTVPFPLLLLLFLSAPQLLFLLLLLTFFPHSPVPDVLFRFLQPVDGGDLRAGLSEAEESALGAQVELEREKQARRETTLMLTQVS